MTSFTFFLIFIPLLAFILLAVNLIFAPHTPYQEKNSPFECGFHSFLGQNRTQFSISFFIFALLFLLFDLEILLVYPYVVSAYNNDFYGLIIMLIFFLALTLGFAFELGKNALKIDSRQVNNVSNIQLNLINLNSNVLNICVPRCIVNITHYISQIKLDGHMLGNFHNLDFIQIFLSNCLINKWAALFLFIKLITIACMS
jgi:NADH-ubiquinone oxidoreductase chain 3